MFTVAMFCWSFALTTHLWEGGLITLILILANVFIYPKFQCPYNFENKKSSEHKKKIISEYLGEGGQPCSEISIKNEQVGR